MGKLLGEALNWFRNAIAIIKKTMSTDAIRNVLRDAVVAAEPLVVVVKVAIAATAIVIDKIHGKKLAVAVSLITAQGKTECILQKFEDYVKIVEITPNLLVLMAHGNITLGVLTIPKACDIFGAAYNYVVDYLDNCLNDTTDDRVEDLVDKAYATAMRICTDESYVGKYRTRTKCGLKERSVCVDEPQERLLLYGLLSSDTAKVTRKKRDAESYMGRICGKAKTFYDCTMKIIKATDCPDADKQFNEELVNNGTKSIQYFCEKYKNQESKPSAAGVSHLVAILYYFEIIILNLI